MEDHRRNQEIAELLTIWEWCSKTLHVRWRRKRRSRNGCLMALAFAITEPTPISPSNLAKTYKRLPRPLLSRKKVLTFWKVQPVPLLELCLGCFTNGSPLKAELERIRSGKQDNIPLDKIAKKMSARERRFGSDWYFQGHHPANDYLILKKEMRPLYASIRDYVAKEHSAIDGLALEVLAQGGWQFGELPAASFVRRTPESLLNRSNRLKLWEEAQVILSRSLEDDERLDMLSRALNQKISLSVRAAIEAQGYTVDQVIDDMVNFDMYKSRSQITGSNFSG
jgi:hypothetical protein